MGGNLTLYSMLVFVQAPLVEPQWTRVVERVPLVSAGGHGQRGGGAGRGHRPRPLQRQQGSRQAAGLHWPIQVRGPASSGPPPSQRSTPLENMWPNGEINFSIFATR